LIDVPHSAVPLMTDVAGNGRVELVVNRACLLKVSPLSGIRQILFMMAGSAPGLLAPILGDVEWKGALVLRVL
jgi:hypothetical protein